MERIKYLVCPECYSYKKIIYDVTPAEIKCKDISVEFNPLEPSPFCRCKNCEHYMVDIDEMMCPIILSLNRKGYTTEFCCQGHINVKNGDYNPAYIKFKSNIKLPKDLNRIIPSAWVVEEEKSGFLFKKRQVSIYAYFTSEISKDDPKIESKFNIYRENYMTQLLQFVLKLPWLNKEVELKKGNNSIELLEESNGDE